MERLKAVFGITYESGNHIELVALFDNLEEYDRVMDLIESYLDSSEVHSYHSIRLTPFNDDPNGDILSTDILLSLKNLQCVKVACELIKYEEPKR